MNRTIDIVFAYKKVYQRIHSAILQGTLKPGERLPSTRSLAREMGLSRGTVEEGYALLKSEGYIEAKGQTGTLVSHNVLEPSHVQLPTRNTQECGFTSQIHVPDILPFQLGIPALDAFPYKTWSRMAARCARNAGIDNLVCPSPYGLPELRKSIARYLQLYRGVECQPTQVFITSGYVNSISWIAKVLLKLGDQVGVEDPGYPLTARILNTEGYIPSPIPVDSSGVTIPESRNIKAMIVTPAHQSPTCVSLSLHRRQLLLDWAVENQAWIIEDDYDGEYRHTGLPLPALKSLDTHDRVIYSGTFSKVLFPSLRTAYVVVPQNLVGRFEQQAELFAGNVSGLTQSCILAFMQEGHLARHIQRMRKLYGIRREFVVDIFRQYLGDKISIEPQPGGMHLVIRLNSSDISDVEVSNKMKEAGLFAQALSHWSSKPVHPSLILSFTNIKTTDECKALAKRLNEIL